ncbi:MAG: ferredoxin-thioredoxin reductase catalytic domain-containing protein [Candidatus Aminicenantales bacterium]
MKKFWRCFVCNDIHYGAKPPEICPTCQVKNAYVEISFQEAEKFCSSGAGASVPFQKDDFLKAIEKFAEKNEFRVNPDQERVAMLLEGIFNNERNHGIKYCPCRLMTKDFAEDIKIVCPCNFLIHETYKDKGECWCGLFIKR